LYLYYLVVKEVEHHVIPVLSGCDSGRSSFKTQTTYSWNHKPVLSYEGISCFKIKEPAD